MKKIFYICNRKACGENNECREGTLGQCRHTSNIEHAVNFEEKHTSIYEKEKRPHKLHSLITSARTRLLYQFNKKEIKNDTQSRRT